MIKNILFATDFSKNAENALPFAIDITRRSKGVLSLLHVFETQPMAPVNIFTSRQETESLAAESMRSAAMARLDKIAEDHLEGIQYRCITEEGAVHEGITKAVLKNEISLLVMGTQGQTAERGLFMGSVTKGIIKNSACPVLAIPEKANFTSISTIVYATDLHRDESHVVDYLIRFAKLYDATVVIMHIDHEESEKQWSLDKLHEIIDATDYGRIAYKEIIAEDVSNGINAYIDERQPDVIAMTRNTHTLFDSISHSSLTKEMLMHTDIPLLAFSRKEFDTIFLG